MGKAHSKRLSIRPDGPRPAPGQIILIHHGAIQKPQWVQHIEGEIGDNPLRGEVLRQPFGLVAAAEEPLENCSAFIYTRIFHASFSQTRFKSMFSGLAQWQSRKERKPHLSLSYLYAQDSLPIFEDRRCLSSRECPDSLQLLYV